MFSGCVYRDEKDKPQFGYFLKLKEQRIVIKVTHLRVTFLFLGGVNVFILKTTTYDVFMAGCGGVFNMIVILCY